MMDSNKSCKVSPKTRSGVNKVKRSPIRIMASRTYSNPVIANPKVLAMPTPAKKPVSIPTNDSNSSRDVVS